MADKTSISNESSVSNKLEEPGLFNVLLHNDDYTSMDFVVDVLVSIFRKNSVEASKIMMEVHKKGAGIAGVYPYDIGITKVHEVKRRAKVEKYPLLCTLEKV
ncbi:ATP-dependent Clp protease adaptor ClpS [Thiospirochaeta perfilievii]|uniref:ATP-dependent Clp protease adapter protein ClpS n=1 Tax=Thiospirochaeta perfilievii TaxID=252967 RepID=A0A5C1Q852_9SPIO|nr:ATP-dependent Clp protease adaptor ClpS [Thiospirochaeta perfilievii]QEN03587.1 ATP-dependent Clp protease adaptor ClpS [Thiospirochaeta perfilievii]